MRTQPPQGPHTRPLKGKSCKWILLAVALAAQQSAAESAGERIAQKGADHPGAVACASCHGEDGSGNEQAGFPRLAGVDAVYIENQLHAYQKGNRKNPVMGGMAAPLSDQDIKAVAGYYAGLDPVSHAQAPAAISTATGEQLARYVDMPERRLPACFQCHGPGGVGVGKSFPPLAGQPYSYLLAQLKAWQSGARAGVSLGLMQAVARKLADAETKSAAAYLATQPLANAEQSASRPDAGKLPGSNTKLPATASVGAGSVVPSHHGAVEPGRTPGKAGYFQPPLRGA